ncbi:twin-arginine translocation signal domain-containing protein, partial [Escherichia coli]
MLLKTSRRTFLKGLTLSGVAGSLGVWSFNARSSLSLPVAASLQGTQFDLTIGETAVNITGSERQAKTINGGLPGPVLRWKEGDTITLKGTVAKLAMRQPFVLFKGLTFQKLCLPGAFRPGD